MRNKNKLIALIAILIIIKLAFSFFLFKKLNGFTFLGGDESSKILMAWESKGNFKSVLGNDMWLPMHTWLLILGLKIFPNAILLSPIMNLIFSTATLIILFFLTHEFSGRSLPVSFIAALFFIFHPFFAWLGISGWEMSILQFFILAGVFSWVQYKNSGTKVWLIMTSIAFCFSSSIRYEGWIFVFIFTFLALRALRNERAPKISILISLIIAYLFIAFWFFWQKIHFGSPLFFLFRQYNTGHNEGTFLNQISLSYLGTLIFVSKVTLKLLSWPALLFFTIGVFVTLRRRTRGFFDYLFFVLASFAILFFLHSVKLCGSWFEKQLTTVLLLLFPLCALGFWRGFSSRFRNFMVVPFAIISLFFIKISYLDDEVNRSIMQPQVNKIRKVINYLNGLKMDNDSKILLEIRTSEEGGNYLYESWFFMPIKPGYVIPDREFRYVQRQGKEYVSIENNPSKFDLSQEELKSYIVNDRIGVVIAICESTKNKLENFMSKAFSVGEYALYVPKDEFIYTGQKKR